MAETVTRPVPGTRLWGFSGGAMLVVGVLLVPMLIGMVFNSYAAPDAAAFVRMAFAQVAGATIAIITVAALLVHRIVRRSPLSTILWWAFLALAIVAWELVSIGQAAQLLLARLGVEA